MALFAVDARCFVLLHAALRGVGPYGIMYPIPLSLSPRSWSHRCSPPPAPPLPNPPSHDLPPRPASCTSNPSPSEGKPSWTARLLSDPQLLCKKVREEAGELCQTLEAAEGPERAASEMADLLYHSMVLLNLQVGAWCQWGGGGGCLCLGLRVEVTFEGGMR